MGIGLRSGYPRGKPHSITPDRTRIGNEPDAKTHPWLTPNLDSKDIEFINYF
jgi:hypothetical protein